MNHFLKVIELYAIKPSFTINGHAQYTNLLDHLLSLITIIIILVFGCYFFSDLFTKNNPHITSSENNDIFPPKIYLNNEDFIIATGLLETIYKFKYVNKAYQNTGIYLELIRFLKLYNDVDLVKKFFFNENNYRLIEHDYSFFRNSEITVTHYKSAFKYIPFYNNNNNKTTFSNLIVQESV